MARRRYVSTNVSIDGRLNRLAMGHGDFPALLYTWMIPHAGDDGTLRGDPDEIMAQVFPLRRDLDGPQIRAALELLAGEDCGLIAWDPAAKVVAFPYEAFYRYQSYIKEGNRRREREGGDDEPAVPAGGEVRGSAALPAQNSADPRTLAAIPGDDGANQRKSAQNAVSFPPSFPVPVSSPVSVPSEGEGDPGGEVGGGAASPPAPPRAPAPDEAIDPAIAAGQGRPKGRRAAARRDMPLPRDFPLTDEMRDWAAERAPGVDVEHEHEKFCAYWWGRGERRSDWLASWRYWVLRDVGKPQRSPPGGGTARRGGERLNGDDAATEAIRLLRGQGAGGPIEAEYTVRRG